MCALNDIKLGTQNWRVELDSTMGLVEELMKQVAILSTHIHDLGGAMLDHIDVTNRVQYPTGVGPTGPCLNAFKQQYEAIFKQIDTKFLPAVKNRKDSIDEINIEFQKMRRSPDEKPNHNSKKNL